MENESVRNYEELKHQPHTNHPLLTHHCTDITLTKAISDPLLPKSVPPFHTTFPVRAFIVAGPILPLKSSLSHTPPLGCAQPPFILLQLILSL